MTWFKIDDSFDDHPKVLAAGNEAAGLFVRCGAYAARHLTDGFVPAPKALMYGSKGLITRLVNAVLFHPVDGGWLIHDYLDYNPSRDQVLKDRKAASDRQKRARDKARESRSSHGVTNGEVTPAVTVPPTRPDPTRTAAAAADAAAAGGDLPVPVAILRSKLQEFTPLRALRFDTLTDTQVDQLSRLIDTHGDGILVDVAKRTCRATPPIAVTAFLGTWAALPEPGTRLRAVDEPKCPAPGHEHETARTCRLCAADRLAGDA
jgi:hypothetical protein